jgi:hypothetical protein
MSNVHTDIAQKTAAVKHRMKPGIKAASVGLYLAGAGLLAFIFASYLQPSFMLDLGTRFVMCF